MGNDCSLEVVGLQETAVVVSTFVFLLLVGNNSDNMGNKEFRDGFFSVNDGISLLKFPVVDIVRVVFLLYHMKSIPKTIKHMPVTTNIAKINLGDNVKGYFSSIVSSVLSKISIDMVGNFNTPAFNDSISSLVKIDKISFIPDYKIRHISILKIII